MKAFKKNRKALIVFIASLLFANTSAQQDRSGLFEGSGDIGNPKLKGSFEYSPSTKVYTLTGGGKIFKITPVDPEEPQIINTGFATRCNNDHMISADGKYLVISNSPAEGGSSKIYTMPFIGGTPQLVTPHLSPDSKRFAFVSYRLEN